MKNIQKDCEKRELPKSHRLRGIFVGQEATQIFHENERIVVGFQIPIVVAEMRVDVFVGEKNLVGESIVSVVE